MAFIDLYSELTGIVPKLPVDYAKTLINRAWRDVSRKNLWSYQLFEANWVSPNALNAGMVTTVQGLNTVTFDSTASTAITALSLLGPFPTPLIQRQFRVGIGTIYNIWGYSATGNIVTLTLDRPYAEPSGTSKYTIFQCYYPVPMQDFLMWINIRDIVNFNDLVLTQTRKEIDFRDPQRTIFYLPTHVVYYQLDMNPNSPTQNYSLYELWGQPQIQLVYQLAGIRRGALLVNDTDTLPLAVGEDCVMAAAKVHAYAWAEANKGDIQRGAGSDYRFLMQAAASEYKKLYAEYRKDDRETVDNWFEIRRHRSWLSNIDGYYNSLGHSANPGAPW